MKRRNHIEEYKAEGEMVFRPEDFQMHEWSSPHGRDMAQVFESCHPPILSHFTPKLSPACGKTVAKKI